jgi:hypothetical protein
VEQPGTLTLADDRDGAITVLLERRRYVVVPLRWPGLARTNLIALFPTLRSATAAARRLGVDPHLVSALALVPVDPRLLSSVAVGVHTAEPRVIADAAAVFEVAGARHVHEFTGPDRDHVRGAGRPDEETITR